MSYSLIPTADYKAMCDAIRSRTGKTDLIKSGGGASEIEDASTVLFRKAVDNSLTEINADDLLGITSIVQHGFYGRSNLKSVSIPRRVSMIKSAAFKNCTELTEVTIMGRPYSIATDVFEGCAKLTTINVSWKEGEVAGAPWGATNATINYNRQLSYLTFSSSDAFTIATSNKEKNWDGTLYYSTDTKIWNEWDGASPISSAERRGEQCIYMRGSGNSKITGSAATGSNGKGWLLNSSADVMSEGNIETLLDYETVLNGEHPHMAWACFGGMFYGWNNLSTAPELQAVSLSAFCYCSMFERCKRLTTMPKLPATDLSGANGCYRRMFTECSQLQNVSELPATILSNECYRGMFGACTMLLEIPELPATELTQHCYEEMFYSCHNVKISETYDKSFYPNEYRIPSSGTGTFGYDAESTALTNMFYGTGGTFTGTPEINKTYYKNGGVV